MTPKSQQLWLLSKTSQRKRRVMLKITASRWFKEKPKISRLSHRYQLCQAIMLLGRSKLKLMMLRTHSTRKKEQLWPSFRNFQKRKLTVPNKELNSSKEKRLLSIMILLYMKEVLRKWHLSDQSSLRLRLLLKTFLESTTEPKV